MTSLYIICFVLLSAGIILLLGLTPESVTDDIMRIFALEQTLRDKVLIAKNKKKSRRITKMLLHTRDALTAVGKSGQFTLTCAASLMLLIAGCIVAVMVQLLHDSGLRAGVRGDSVSFREKYDQGLRQAYS